MTMQFKCDCCGEVVDVPQWGAPDSASVSNDGSPPKGFRTIYTTIEEHDGDGGVSASTGEVLHSCADCNVNMSVDEHLEAELEARRRAMNNPQPPPQEAPHDE